MAEPTRPGGDDLDDIVNDENTPLIAVPSKAAVAITNAGLSSRRGSLVSSIAGAGIHIPHAHNPSTVLWILCGMVLFGASAGALVIIPQMRIFEDILCHRYYDLAQSFGEPIDEKLCKVDEIQSKLAYLFAINDAITAAANCLAALPWGIAADKIGRRPVAALSLAGLGLSLVIIIVVGWFPSVFPVYAIWASGSASLLGGGNAVIIAVLSGIVTDIVPEADRAVAFMRLHLASQLGNLLAPSISSVLMPRTGPWPLMFAGVTAVLICSASSVFLPESLRRKAESEDERPTGSGVMAPVARAIDALKDSVAMLNNPSLLLLLGLLLLAMPVPQSTMQFLTVFASKRYHILLAETGYVQTIFGIAHIAVLLAVLPYLSHAMSKPSAPRWMRIADDQRRDFFLARTSLGVQLVGVLGLGLAPNLASFILALIVLSIGSGAISIVKSLVSVYVDPEHRSRLYSIVGILDMTSQLFTTPMLAALFSEGLHLGGFWIGLPYFGVSLFVLAQLVLSLPVRLPSAAGEAVRDSDEESNGDGSDLHGPQE